MIEEDDIYAIYPPYRDEGTLIKPITPGLEIPKEGILRVPGYLEKVREVERGLREPFWGVEYAFDDPRRPADLVTASPLLFAASEALRRVLNDVKGVRFFPIRVDGSRTMYLLGVPGLVGVGAAPMRLILLDGAEIGIYDYGYIHVNARIARRIKAAKLDLDVEVATVTPGYPGT